MTDFLFAKPSFVEGAATVLDLFGLLHDYNRSENGDKADAWALYHDFRAVGLDIETALEQYKTERQSHSQETISAI